MHSIESVDLFAESTILIEMRLARDRTCDVHSACVRTRPSVPACASGRSARSCPRVDRTKASLVTIAIGRGVSLNPAQG